MHSSILFLFVLSVMMHFLYSFRISFCQCLLWHCIFLYSPAINCSSFPSFCCLLIIVTLLSSSFLLSYLTPFVPFLVLQPLHTFSASFMSEFVVHTTLLPPLPLYFIYFVFYSHSSSSCPSHWPWGNVSDCQRGTFSRLGIVPESLYTVDFPDEEEIGVRVRSDVILSEREKERERPHSSRLVSSNTVHK